VLVFANLNDTSLFLWSSKSNMLSFSRPGLFLEKY